MIYGRQIYHDLSDLSVRRANFFDRMARAVRLVRSRERADRFD